MRLITYNPLFTSRWANWQDADTFSTPSVNISEKENGFFVELVSPGWNKEDFKVSIHKKQLTITAEKKVENSQDSDKILQKEYSLQSFKRSFHLPDTVEEDAIEANYEQGILKLFIPKKAEVVPPVKTIEIG
jgi:HSP20 family protein